MAIFRDCCHSCSLHGCLVPLLKMSPGCFRLPAVPSFLLACSSAVSLCQSGLNVSLSVIARGLWQLSIPLAFVFRSALLTVSFAILASVNYVRLLGGNDQTTRWQYQCGRAVMDPHSAVCLSVYHHLPAHWVICWLCWCILPFLSSSVFLGWRACSWGKKLSELQASRKTVRNQLAAHFRGFSLTVRRWTRIGTDNPPTAKNCIDTEL